MLSSKVHIITQQPTGVKNISNLPFFTQVRQAFKIQPQFSDALQKQANLKNSGPGDGLYKNIEGESLI